MKKRQRGTTTVEFAIIGTLFMIVLFGVIEFGRLLFTWNTLTEATRRGARVAVVCPVGDDAPKNIAIFNSAGTSANSPILPGLSPANVAVAYLNENGVEVPNPTDPANFLLIRYVRVGIINYTHNLLIPTLTQILNAPAFETTLPRESLGVVPDVGTGCFGSYS